SEIVFSDGTTLSIKAQDVLVIVGPNNAGKSATLRGIQVKLKSSSEPSHVLTSIVVTKEGDVIDLEKWVTQWTRRKPTSDAENPQYAGLGATIHQSVIRFDWQQKNSLGHLTRWMCHFLTADERLQICNPPKTISFSQEGQSHPIHYLQRDDSLELNLSAKFHAAFGVDMIVHRNAGSTVPVHVGERPAIELGEDRVSFSYIKKLEQLPCLHEQGDGMRSFAGVLLATSVGREAILLIDEPEAFLHPPQARLLGETLVESKGDSRQLFIATHSSDVLRGILNTNSPDVKVARIRRNGGVNSIKLLDNSRIKELWGDPLLRYSNIFDGLFHEGVVVCEGDADCRFYAAVLDAVCSASGGSLKRPDMMFTHCGGKARLPMVIRALREVDVPVCAVADFDVFSDEEPLKSIIEALGKKWADFSKDWKTVKSAIDSKRPDLSTEDVKNEIAKILKTVSSSSLPEAAREDLRTVLRKSSAWSIAKLVGCPFVPSGDPTKACENLLQMFREAGLHVVEVGEVEGFVRAEAGHGPKWVNAVLSRNLAIDPALETARAFVKRLI
ncbi:MAG TPA: AAA family ATPase, partial [Xanthomonadaceae bacterium]